MGFFQRFGRGIQSGFYSSFSDFGVQMERQRQQKEQIRREKEQTGIVEQRSLAKQRLTQGDFTALEDYSSLYGEEAGVSAEKLAYSGLSNQSDRLVNTINNSTPTIKYGDQNLPDINQPVDIKEIRTYLTEIDTFQKRINNALSYEAQKEIPNDELITRLNLNRDSLEAAKQKASNYIISYQKGKTNKSDLQTIMTYAPTSTDDWKTKKAYLQQMEAYGVLTSESVELRTYQDARSIIFAQPNAAEQKKILNKFQFDNTIKENILQEIEDRANIVRNSDIEKALDIDRSLSTATEVRNYFDILDQLTVDETNAVTIEARKNKVITDLDLQVKSQYEIFLKEVSLLARKKADNENQLLLTTLRSQSAASQRSSLLQNLGKEGIQVTDINLPDNSGRLTVEQYQASKANPAKYIGEALNEVSAYMPEMARRYSILKRVENFSGLDLPTVIAEQALQNLNYGGDWPTIQQQIKRDNALTYNEQEQSIRLIEDIATQFPEIENKLGNVAEAFDLNKQFGISIGRDEEPYIERLISESQKLLLGGEPREDVLDAVYTAMREQELTGKLSYRASDRLYDIFLRRISGQIPEEFNQRGQPLLEVQPLVDVDNPYIDSTSDFQFGRQSQERRQMPSIGNAVTGNSMTENSIFNMNAQGVPLTLPTQSRVSQRDTTQRPASERLRSGIRNMFDSDRPTSTRSPYSMPR